MVAHNLSTGDTEAGSLQAQFKACLGYMSESCLNKNGPRQLCTFKKIVFALSDS